MQIEGVTITIHEAAEILREELTKRLGADEPLRWVHITSHNKPVLSIEFANRMDGSKWAHRWEQYRDLVHLTKPPT